MQQNDVNDMIAPFYKYWGWFANNAEYPNGELLAWLWLAGRGSAWWQVVVVAVAVYADIVATAMWAIHLSDNHHSLGISPIVICYFIIWFTIHNSNASNT